MAERGYEIAQSNAAWILDKYGEHNMWMDESGLCTDAERHQRAHSLSWQASEQVMSKVQNFQPHRIRTKLCYLKDDDLDPIEYGGIMKFIQVSFLGSYLSSPSRFLRAKVAAKEAVLGELLGVITLVFYNMRF
ncbi:hypothetical protein SCA6_001024 [Theobroma cacao]